MAANIYINVKQAPDRSLVNNQTNYLALVDAPEFVQGEQRTFNLYFVDGAGDYDALSGDSNYSVRMAIGARDAAPTGGTFTITGDGSDLTGTTAAIDYDATAAEVVSALTNAATGLTKVAATGILESTDIAVTKLRDGYYNIEFKGDLEAMDVGMLTVASEGLTPTSNDIVSEFRMGSATVNEIQTIKLIQAPVAIQTTWPTITDGFSATIDLNTTGVTQALGDQTDGVVELYLTISVDDASSNTTTYVQRTVSVRASADDTTATQPTPIASATVQNANFILSRGPRQGVVLDGTAGEILVYQDTGGEIGTSDFTLGLVLKIADFTPAANTVLLDSIDGSTNGIQLSLLATGIIRLAFGNGTDITTYQYDSTVALSSSGGMLHLIINADRSGNVDFYQGGTKLGASVDISGSSAQTLTSTQDYQIGTDGSSFFAMTVFDFYLHLTLQTAADILYWAQTGQAPSGFGIWLDIESYTNGYFIVDRASNNLDAWLSVAAASALPLLAGEDWLVTRSLTADAFMTQDGSDAVCLPSNNVFSQIIVVVAGAPQTVEIFDDNGGNSILSIGSFSGLKAFDLSELSLDTSTTNKLYVDLGSTSATIVVVKGTGTTIT